MAAALIAVSLGPTPVARGADVADPEEICAGDVIAINVAWEPDLTGEYSVDASGSVLLPLVGPIDVAGLQVSEAERRIKAALANGFLTHPMVNVTVVRHVEAGFVAGAPIDDVDVIVASGTLQEQFLAGGALFHLGALWIRVPPGTEFNRWLSQGLDRNVVFRLMTDPDRFADKRNVRILTGTLIHQIAPRPTPANLSVFGELPAGDLSIVHMVFLWDERMGTLGPLTMETADFATATTFDPYDNTEISVVIEIQ